jgi:hypothetical protein
MRALFAVSTLLAACGGSGGQEIRDGGQGDAGARLCSPADAGTDAFLDVTETTCGATRVVDLATAALHQGLRITYQGNVGPSRDDVQSPTECTPYRRGEGGKEIVHRLHLTAKADVWASTRDGGALHSLLYMVPACTPGMASSDTPCDVQGYRSNDHLFGFLSLPGLDAGDYFLVVDGWDAESSAIDVGAYELEVQLRPIRAQGETCDPALVLDRCDTGMGCKPRQGRATCEPTQRPVLEKLAFFQVSGNRYRLVMHGTSTDGDVTGLVVRHVDAEGRSDAEESSSFSNYVVGQNLFRAHLDWSTYRGNTPYHAMRVRLQSVSYGLSEPLEATLEPLPTPGLAEECDPGLIESRCVSGHYCQPSVRDSAKGVCVPATAPVVDKARAYVLPDGSRRIVVEGSDNEGHFPRLSVTFLDVAGDPIAVDLWGSGDVAMTSVFGFDQVIGENPFQARSELPAKAFDGLPVTEVRLKLIDETLLESSELVVPFLELPSPHEGEPCDTKGMENLCAPSAAGEQVCDGVAAVCTKVGASRTAVCEGALELTVDVPATGNVPFGPDLWAAPCTSDPSGGSEAIYKLTTTTVLDLLVSTDSPDTKVNTILYAAETCDKDPAILGCDDDVDAPEGERRLGSSLALADLPPGTHYFWVDSWTYGDTSGGSGPFRILATTRPVLHGRNATCDPRGEKDRCGCGLQCKADPSLHAFACQ